MKMGKTANSRKATLITGFSICALLFGVCIPAQGQRTSDNVPRIGFLQRRFAPTPTNPDPLANAFLQGLRELGYIDGKNIIVEHRYAGGKSESLSPIIAEFLQLKVDVIVVPGSPAIRAARLATKTVPIVIVTQSDPVADKLVDSLAHPGGNITGLTRLTSELSGKRLQLFKEALPTIARVATLIGGAELIENVGDYEATARTLNLTLLPVRLAGTKPDMEAVFQNMEKSGVNALIVNRDALTASYMSRIAELAVRHRLPSMALDPDPVGNGFVASLARPGGNVTGVSALSPDLSGKQLEILKEIVPKLSRVAVLGSSNRPGNAQILKEAELAAETMSIRLQYLDVLNSKDIDSAFRGARKEHAQAVLVLTGPQLNSRRRQITDLAAKNHLPAIYEREEFINEGGLSVYGASVSDLSRRAATYVDKILKGAKPAELPIEQPTKFELLINLKAAKQIGLTIPPNVLARADRVIR